MIGFDLAKSTVHFVGLDEAGQVLTRRKYSKGKLLEVTAKMRPYRIGIEACCGSHHVGRKLLAQGHDVKLMPPSTSSPSSSATRTTPRMPRLAPRPACARPCASWM